MAGRWYLPARFALALVLSGGMLACSSDGTGPSQNGGNGGNGGGGGGGTVRTITITDFSFSPSPVTVEPGTQVRWQNNGPSPHTTTAAGLWDSGAVPVNGTFTRTFSATGTFNYVCTLHPGMAGQIVVE